MQKGFKLLQTDLEGGEELQEATNGAVQPHPSLITFNGKEHTV